MEVITVTEMQGDGYIYISGGNIFLGSRDACYHSCVFSGSKYLRRLDSEKYLVPGGAPDGRTGSEQVQVRPKTPKCQATVLQGVRETVPRAYSPHCHLRHSQFTLSLTKATSLSYI